MCHTTEFCKDAGALLAAVNRFMDEKTSRFSVERTVSSKLQSRFVFTEQHEGFSFCSLKHFIQKFVAERKL